MIETQVNYIIELLHASTCGMVLLIGVIGCACAIKPSGYGTHLLTGTKKPFGHGRLLDMALYVATSWLRTATCHAPPSTSASMKFPIMSIWNDCH